MSKTLKISSKALLVVLPILCVIIAYLISKTEDKTGFIFIVTLLGLFIGTSAIVFPHFGYYFSIAFSFIAFDLNRLMPVGVSLISLIDFLILATFLGFIIKKMIKKESFWENCNHPIIYIYLLYAFYTLVQLFNPNAVSSEVSISIVRKFFNLLLILYCSIQVFNTESAIKTFFKVWLFFAALCASYGCYQEWLGYPDYELNYIMSDPLLVGLYTLTTGGLRKFSSLSDPKNFGLLMAACALISIVFIQWKAIKGKAKAPYILYLILFLLGMSYSGTRTANFMMVMGVVMYSMMTFTNKNTLIFIMIASMVFVIIMYGPIYGNNTVNRIRSTFDFEKEESLKVRDVNRKNIQPYIYSHPIGGGLGTTGIDNLVENSSHPLAGFPPDSGYLLTALETGWIGLILQMLVYFTILQQGVKAFYHSNNINHRTYLLAAIVALFAFMVAQYAQVSIGQPPGLFIYYAGIAIIIRISQMPSGVTGKS